MNFTGDCPECGLPLPGPHRGTCSGSLALGGTGWGLPSKYAGYLNGTYTYRARVGLGLPRPWKGNPLRIGPGFDSEVSAPVVTHDGIVVGVYIDDTTPDIARWVALAAEKYPRGVVLVGVAPGLRARWNPRPPVVNLQEWYPWRSPFTPRAWGPMPHCEGYILQERFAWPGHRPPARWQTLRLVAEAKLRGARYVFTY